jgi:uncharacterized membrane protein YozB (DUF420 family)
MIELSDLPAVNAALNSVAFVLLTTGYVMIRRGRVGTHRACMIAAFSVSILFLLSYLTYRFLGQEKSFGGKGIVRSVYLAILFSHVALAATVPILASWTLYLGLRGRFGRHQRMARITFPIWVYVSITGVLVYLMLFQLYGPVPVAGR